MPTEQHKPSAEERRRLVAEAAYRRAERRGFQGGDPQEDWLAAEAEVDELFRGRTSEEEERAEVAAYERLRRQVEAMLGEVRGSVDAATLRGVIDRAASDAREAGGYTAETVSRAAAALRKELATTVERLGPHWEALTERSAGVFDVWRNRGSEFLGSAAAASADWLHQFRARRGYESYRTGDVSPPGTYTCTNCGQTLELKETGRLPECPRCHHQEFNLSDGPRSASVP